MTSSPREVVEQVRRMVAGEGVVFADLFAPDGVLEYPFTPPGQPRELRGQEAIRSYFATASGARHVFEMDGVEALVRETDDPEVLVTEIEHHGPITRHRRAIPLPGARSHPGPQRPDRALRGLHGRHLHRTAPRAHRRPRGRSERRVERPR